MDVLFRISVLCKAPLLTDANVFIQQHPEGVHPSPSASVSISTVCSATLLNAVSADLQFTRWHY